MKRMTMKEVADEAFKGNRNKAAEAFGVTLGFFNNWVSQGRTVLALDSNELVLETKTLKIAKIPNAEDKEPDSE